MNEKLSKQSDDWEGHPNPERYITRDPSSAILTGATITEIIRDAIRTSNENGVGVEVATPSGAFVTMAYPGSTEGALMDEFVERSSRIAATQSTATDDNFEL